MIKCVVTLCGVVNRAATVRTNQDGKPFVSFGVAVMVDGKKSIDIGVTKDGNEDVSAYVVGSRISLVGELTLRKIDDQTMYFNLSATSVDFSPSETAYLIKGEMHFLGKTGNSIDAKTTKKGSPVLMFSAFSAQTVHDGFTYTWVRFVQFDSQAPSWLLPKTHIEAKGELELSVWNDRIMIGCRIRELKPYVKPHDSPQPHFAAQSTKEECPF